MPAGRESARSPQSSKAILRNIPRPAGPSVFQRFIYTLTLYLLTPFVLYRLAARGLKYHGYFARWRERFGFFPDAGLRDSIWVHAVSLGEVNAAVPLIEALMDRYRDSQFVITTVTPTGSDRVLQLFGERVFHVYLPYDLTSAVKRFLDRVRPRLAVIMETEIWPNLFMTCADRGIAIMIANARLSERSLRGYWPIQPLVRRAIRCASFVAAQSPSDFERLRALGRTGIAAGRGRQPEVRHGRAGGCARAQRGVSRRRRPRAPGVDRSEYPRGRGTGGAEGARGRAAPFSRCLAADCAASSGTLQTGHAVPAVRTASTPRCAVKTLAPVPIASAS